MICAGHVSTVIIKFYIVKNIYQSVNLLLLNNIEKIMKNEAFAPRANASFS